MNLSGICNDFVHPRPKDIDGNADTNRKANKYKTEMLKLDFFIIYTDAALYDKNPAFYTPAEDASEIETTFQKLLSQAYYFCPSQN